MAGDDGQTKPGSEGLDQPRETKVLESRPPVTGAEAERLSESFRPSWADGDWEDNSSPGEDAPAATPAAGNDGAGPDAPRAAALAPEPADSPPPERPQADEDEQRDSQLPVTKGHRNPLVLYGAGVAVVLVLIGLGFFVGGKEPTTLWEPETAPASIGAAPSGRGGSTRTPPEPASFASASEDPPPPGEPAIGATTGTASLAAGAASATPPPDDRPAGEDRATAGSQATANGPTAAVGAGLAPGEARRPATDQGSSSPRAGDGLVRMQVRTVPEGATLTMDGTRIANPFDARLSEGGRHRLEANLDGYRPKVTFVQCDRDRSVTLLLSREQPARAAGKRPRSERPGFITSNPY